MAIQDARGMGMVHCARGLQLASPSILPTVCVRGRRYVTGDMSTHHTGWRSWLAHLAWASCCSSSDAYYGTTGGRCSQVCRPLMPVTPTTCRSVYLRAGPHATPLFRQRGWRVVRHLWKQQHGVGVRVATNCTTLASLSSQVGGCRQVSDRLFSGGLGGGSSDFVPRRGACGSSTHNRTSITQKITAGALGMQLAGVAVLAATIVAYDYLSSRDGFYY